MSVISVHFNGPTRPSIRYISITLYYSGGGKAVKRIQRFCVKGGILIPSSEQVLHTNDKPMFSETVLDET